MEDTRRGILEATIALHEEIGPRATTISAIAERAGVQRLTVYRHFENETALFAACTGQWLTDNPPPGPDDWAEIPQGDRRRAAALAAFHDYHARTRRMFAAAYRDVADVPALQGPMRALERHLDDTAAALAPDLGPLARGTLRHLIGFPAWQSLHALGWSADEFLRAGTAWIAGARASEADDPVAE